MPVLPSLAFNGLMLRVGESYTFRYMSASFYDKLRISNFPIVKSQLTFTCSKSTIETVENGVRYVQS